MPYYLGEPTIVGEQMIFTWDASFDLQGDPLVYIFQLSGSPDFRKIIEEQKMMDNEHIRSLLQPGTYYYRVITYDSKGNSQVSFDEYRDSKGKLYSGIWRFVIK